MNKISKKVISVILCVMFCFSLITPANGDVLWNDNFDGKGLLYTLQKIATDWLSDKINSVFKSDHCEDDPVNAFSGEFIKTDTDLHISCQGLDINIVRTYRSKKDYNGPYGYNWFLNYQMRVMKLVSGNYLLVDGQGYEHVYVWKETNVQEEIYKASGKYDRLIDHGDGRKTLVENNGLRYLFNSNGCLTQIIDRNNNNLRFEYYQENEVDKELPIIGKSRYFINQDSGVIAMDYQLRKIIDLNNREVVLNYFGVDDGLNQGRLKEIVDFTGRIIHYNYDDEGNLVTFTTQSTTDYPQGLTTTYTYTSGYQNILLNHNLESIKDAKEQVYLINTYDGNDMVSGQMYGEEYSSFIYDIVNRITTYTDRENNKKVITFNAVGNPLNIKVYTKSESPLYYETINEYNEQMDLVKVIFPRGNVVEYEYDDMGNVTQLRQKTADQADSSEDIVISYTYDPIFNQIKTVTDAKNNTYEYIYDYQEGADYAGLGVKIGKTAAEVQVLLGVTPMGQNDLNEDGITNQINGKVIKIIKPIVTNTTPDQIATILVKYNNNGQITYVKNAKGVLTQYGYDANGYLNNIIKDVGGLNITTALIRDNVGNIRNITDPKLKTTVLTVNDLNQVTQIQSPANRLTKFSYDKNGNIERIQKQKDIAGEEWQAINMTYDNLDNIETVTDDLLNVTQYGYDKESNLTSVNDSEGNLTSYIYDERGLISSVNDAENNLTNYSYNENGNLDIVEDANNNKTKYIYDDFDRVTAVNYLWDTVSQTGQSSKIYEYDKNSNLIKFTNRASEQISYQYDELNRLHQKNYLDGVEVIDSSVKYLYDELGRLEKLTNKDYSEISYLYDNLNRVTANTVNAESLTDAKTIAYGYDNNSNRTSITYPDSLGEIFYEYDDLNRLEYINKYTADPNDGEAKESIVHNEYDVLNLLSTVTLLNGVSTAYGYDEISRLTSITNSLSSVSYTYDKVGNKKSMTNSQGKHWYGYDKIYQLKQTKLGADEELAPQIEDFNYDELGNRISSTIESTTSNYAKNGFNQYTSVDGTNYSYDAKGNLTGDDKGTSEETDDVIYNYDYENRMTSVSGLLSSVSYSYDGFGRRTSKTVGTETTNYLYDGDNLLVEYDASWTPKRYYVNGDGIDNPLTLNNIGTETTNTYYYHKDSLGSVTEISNSTGSLIEKYSYDSYGKVTIKDSADAVLEESSIGNRYMFTGREWDNEINLYYYRARHYDPQLGRFLQTDPLGYYDSMNLYQYCNNNPVNYLDPYGLYSMEELGDIAEAFAEGYADGAAGVVDGATNAVTFGHGTNFGPQYSESDYNTGYQVGTYSSYTGMAAAGVGLSNFTSYATYTLFNITPLEWASMSLASKAFHKFALKKAVMDMIIDEGGIWGNAMAAVAAYELSSNWETLKSLWDKFFGDRKDGKGVCK